MCLFQWQGVIESVNVIESGPGWINAYVVASNLDPSFYFAGSIRNIVDGGNLPSFAVTVAEKLFFMMNNVSLLGTPIFGVTEEGYNSGSFLIGLR